MSEDNDVGVFDSTEEPIIVDCDVLEAAKENIQPLAAGRRVTALQAILSTPHALRESRLAATRNRHMINVEVALEDEEDDPVEAYSRFVNWVIENYPQGHSAESGLLELLEEATRVLKDHCDGKWRDDLRYLKLWVLYASYVEKPAIIFKFCMVNDIGTCHALLYEEYAVALERAGRKATADEVYSLGIARRAEPLDRLETRYREFQKRMMSRVTATAPEPSGSAPQAAPSTAAKPRKALADTSRPRPPPSSQTRGTATSRDDVFTLPVDTENVRPNGKMPIFVDPPESAPTEVDAAPWDELGTRKSRVKENLKEVSKAAGTKLHQEGKVRREIAARAPRMPVYRDPVAMPGEGSSFNPSPTVTQPSSAKSNGKAKFTSFPDAEGEADSQPPTAPGVRASSSKFVIHSDQSIDSRSEESPPVPVHEKRVTRSASRAAKTLSGQAEDTVVAPGLAARARSTHAGASAVSQSQELKPVKRGKGSIKAKTTLTHDADAKPSSLPESDAPPREESTASKGKLEVFRDDTFAAPEPSAPSNFTILRDDCDAPAAIPATTPIFASKGKGRAPKIAIFRDEDSAEQIMPPPATVAKKARSASSSKIAIFCDSADEMRDSDTPVVGKTPGSKSKIAIYRDDVEMVGAASSSVMATPTRKFVPFRDDEAPPSPTLRGLVPGSAIKEKGLAPSDAMGVKMSSEAEALKKDPLKNYAEEERILDVD